MKAGTLSEISVWLMDLVALAALGATGEIQPFILGWVAVFFLLSRVRAFAMGNTLLVALLALTISGAAGAWLFFKVPLIVAVAHAAPILHSVLWFGGQRNRERVWRMAVGFVELNVAAVLTAEVYLAPMIFIFALLASIAISAGFLESTARNYEKTAEPVRIPRAFLFSVLRLSFLILLTSFVIFPLLPRVHNSTDADIGTKRTGYTEEVTLSSLAGPAGSGEGKPALSFFVPESQAPNTQFTAYFYLGLIRSRTLSVFDGTTWHPDRKSHRFRPEPPKSLRQEVVIEAIRQPLNTDSLPVPYGTEAIRQANVIRLRSGEWIVPQTQDRRVSYSVVIEEDQITPYGSTREDLPTSVHLEVPAKIKTRGMQNLARKLFTPGMTTIEKVASLQRFFLAEKFAPSTDGGLRNEADYSDRLQPLENFLFLAKKGHCELFSGAAAVLLRMAGVPTRLVAGFRISREPMGGVLTVRTGDAHAWLEFWIPEKGWKALDLTPRVIGGSSSFDILRRIYEAGSAFWYKNVSSFDSDQQFNSGYRAIRSLRMENLNQWVIAHQSLVFWTAVYAALFGFCAFLVIRTWFPWILSIRWRVNQGPPWIKRERIRMEQFLARKLYRRWFLHPSEGLDLSQASRTLKKDFSEAAVRSFSEWEQAYLRARFGAPTESRRELQRELRARRKAFTDRLKSSK